MPLLYLCAEVWFQSMNEASGMVTNVNFKSSVNSA